MMRRFAIVPLLGAASLLTHCALTDHYQLASDAAGVGNDVAGGDSAGNTATGTGGMDVGPGGEGSIAGSSAGGASSAGTAGVTESGGIGGDVAHAGGAGMSSQPCTATCTAAQTCCGASCTDTNTDPKNCGGCGVACSDGRACTAGVCKAGWVPMLAPPSGFVARTQAAACAMGSSVFIWGGADANALALDTGAIYSPIDNTWTTVSKGAGMPSARTFATCVWTGSVVIVYGGLDSAKKQAPLSSGSIYDPKTSMWTALPDGPTPRSQPVAYWDGSRALFWGGNNGPPNVAVAGVDRFDLTSWKAANSGGDPGAVLAPAYAFDGSTVYLQGGLLGMVRQDRVSSYTGDADKWATLSKSLTPRSSAFGVWDGSSFLVWGGHGEYALNNDGKYLTGTTWTTMNTTGAPMARMLSVRRSGWAFMIKPGVVGIFGGQINLQGTGLLSNNGAVYATATNQWKPIADAPSGEDHEYGVGVWTGQEFVLWSGRNGAALTGTGERLAF